MAKAAVKKSVTKRKKVSAKKTTFVEDLAALEKAGSIASRAIAHKAKNPKATTKEIAAFLETSYGNVYQALKKKGKKTKGKLKRVAKEKANSGSTTTENVISFIGAAAELGIDQAILLLAKIKSGIGGK